MRNITATSLLKEKAGMQNIVSLLDWDSNYFGFPIAQIEKDTITKYEMDETLNYCYQNKVRLLQFKCDAHNRDSILQAELNKFHFADLRMIFKAKLDSQQEKKDLPCNMIFRKAKIVDIDLLMNLAEKLYVNSRYYFDTNFPRSKVRNFYRDWVRKAVLSKFDDLAWLLCIENKIVAFCSVRFFGKKATIGLVGVHPGYIGQGIGRLMLHQTLINLKKHDILQVEVVTQGRNYPAQRLYQKVGFTIQKSQIYYHRWFNEPEQKICIKI